MQKRKFLPIPLLLALLLFLVTSATVQASALKDFVAGVKDAVSPSRDNGELKIESDINFAKDGDKNNNGQFDAGETLTFSFKIQNHNGKEYPFSVLKTKVPANSINYIHNIKGVTGISREGDFIELRNIYINKNQIIEISFDADITSFNTGNKDLSVSAELFSEDKKKLKEVSGKKINIRSSENHPATAGISSKGVPLNPAESLKEESKNESTESAKISALQPETNSSSDSAIEIDNQENDQNQ